MRKSPPFSEDRKPYQAAESASKPTSPSFVVEYCTNCGHGLVKDARFCTHCGASAEEVRKIRKQLTCACGALKIPNAKFCLACGQPILNKDTAK